MKKVAIIRCLKTSASCAGAGCLRVMYDKEKRFAQYGDEELRLMAMWTCNGCGDSMLENQDGIRKKIERMKDLEIDVCRSVSPFNKKKQDTKYSNTVNDGYVNALDDIKFKITSKNDSNIAYSKAIVNGSWLDKLTNTIDGASYKPEEYLIRRIIGQYNHPKMKLMYNVTPDFEPYSKLAISSLNGVTLMFTGGTIDFENNSIECNLIENNGNN